MSTNCRPSVHAICTLAVLMLLPFLFHESATAHAQKFDPSDQSKDATSEKSDEVILKNLTVQGTELIVDYHHGLNSGKERRFAVTCWVRTADAHHKNLGHWQQLRAKSDQSTPSEPTGTKLRRCVFLLPETLKTSPNDHWQLKLKMSRVDDGMYHWCLEKLIRAKGTTIVSRPDPTAPPKVRQPEPPSLTVGVSSSGGQVNVTGVVGPTTGVVVEVSLGCGRLSIISEFATVNPTTGEYTHAIPGQTVGAVCIVCVKATKIATGEYTIICVPVTIK